MCENVKRCKGVCKYSGIIIGYLKGESNRWGYCTGPLNDLKKREVNFVVTLNNYNDIFYFGFFPPCYEFYIVVIVSHKLNSHTYYVVDLCKNLTFFLFTCLLKEMATSRNTRGRPTNASIGDIPEAAAAIGGPAVATTPTNGTANSANLTDAAIRALIAQGVADAMAQA